MIVQPVIVGFLCNWCAYQALDRAGEQRVGHGADFRVIRVMCSGQVGPELILRALASGAHGVLIAGCRAGECHYGKGNIIARQRFTLLQRLIVQLGMPPQRLQLLWVAAAEGEALIKAITDMADGLKINEAFADPEIADEQGRMAELIAKNTEVKELPW